MLIKFNKLKQSIQKRSGTKVDKNPLSDCLTSIASFLEFIFGKFKFITSPNIAHEKLQSIGNTTTNKLPQKPSLKVQTKIIEEVSTNGTLTKNAKTILLQTIFSKDNGKHFKVSKFFLSIEMLTPLMEHIDIRAHNMQTITKARVKGLRLKASIISSRFEMFNTATTDKTTRRINPNIVLKTYIGLEKYLLLSFNIKL